MEFRLLGPVEIAARGRPVPLSGARQRTLLALLLLNAERTAPLSALVDAVWDERPPGTAKRQVQNTVSALRRLLDAAATEPVPPTIVGENDGYRLCLGSATLDLALFQERLATARQSRLASDAERAVDELRAAEALWRGPALAGLAGRVVQAAAARLDEQRRTAAEDRIDLELELGHHAELIGELTELAAVHPLRERLTGQLMLALYRSERQPEALAAYRRLRDRLAEEMGLDPGTSLRNLHTEILTDAATPPPSAPARRPASVPAQLPPDVPAFAGRAAELKELNRIGASASAASAVTICVISGTAGVGKTSLTVHWSHRIRRLFPDGQLYVNLRGFDPAGPAMDPADALRGFLDALGVPPERVPVDLPDRSALLRSLLADRRVLIVLDNARDAEQVRALLPGSPGCLAVVTSRSLLPGLIAAVGAQLIALDLLDPSDARLMLVSRVGPDRVAAEREAADEIITHCARLPLAIAVAAARAVTHPAFPLATIASELRPRPAPGVLDRFAGGDPATDVRAVFSWSYQQLGAPARRMFRLLGLHPGPDFTVLAAASLAAVPQRQAAAALAELADANLISEHVPGRYAFHDLLRGFAAELVESQEPEGERRSATHRLLDHYLRSACAADRLLDPFRDPIPAPPTRPGVTVAPTTDHDGAMDWFAVELPGLLAGVERAGEAGFDPYAWRLAWSLAYFLERRGHWLPWAAAQRTALGAAERLDDRTGQAHAHRSLGRVNVHLGRTDEAVGHLRQAQRLFQETGDLAGQARVHFDLCWIAARRGDHHDSLAHALKALTLFQRTDNRSGQSRAFNNVAWGHNLVGDHQQALAAGEQALALSREVGDRYGEADTWDTLGHAHLALRRHQEGIRCYRRAIAIYRELGHRWGEADTLARLGQAYDVAGEPRAAARAWEHAVVILDELGHPDADQVRAKLARSGG